MQKPFTRPASPQTRNQGPQQHGSSLGGTFATGMLVCLAGVFLGAILSAQLNILSLVTLGIILVIVTIRYPIVSVVLAASSDLTCYYISGLTKLPPRIYLIVLVSLVSIPKIITVWRTSPFLRKTIGIMVAFAVLRTSVDWYWGLDSGNLLRQVLARHASPALIFLCCAAYARTRAEASMILTALIGATTLSGLFGIMQFHGIPFGWGMHDLLTSFVKAEKLDESIDMARLFGALMRPKGLAWSTIDLGYHLVCAIGVAFPIAVLSDIPRRTRILLAGSLIILLIATIESLTRSAIVGMALVIAATLWIQTARSPTRRGHRPWLLIGMAGLTIFLSFRTLGPSSQAKRVYSFADETRTSLYVGSLRLIAWNPMGIGAGNRERVAREHQSELNDLPDPTALLDLAPHNGFLLTTLNWGLPAFALCIAFISIMLKEAKRLRAIAHHLPPPFSWVGYIVPLFLLGYLPNTLFHNAIPFNGDMVFWYYLGVFAGLSSVLQSAPSAPAPRPERQTPNLKRNSPIRPTSKGTPLTP